MAESLCGIFRASGGDESVLPELQAFLNCILLYLKEETPPEDFCYASLEMLVPTMKEVSQKEISVFHIILTKAIRRSGSPKELANRYRMFQSVMTICTPLRLLTVLNQIRNYIQEERLGSEIQLKLTA